MILSDKVLWNFYEQIKDWVLQKIWHWHDYGLKLFHFKEQANSLKNVTKLILMYWHKLKVIW